MVTLASSLGQVLELRTGYSGGQPALKPVLQFEEVAGMTPWPELGRRGRRRHSEGYITPGRGSAFAQIAQIFSFSAGFS